MPTVAGSWWPALVGTVASALMIFGLLVGIGRAILWGFGQAAPAAAATALGAAGTWWALRALERRSHPESGV